MNATLKLRGGIIYTIPNEIVPLCKTIHIGYNRFKSELFLCSRFDRQKRIFSRNKEDLEGYIHIGSQEPKWNDVTHFYVEVHWFVPKDRLKECRCDVSD